jgi:uncharacterized protein DUF11
MPALRPQHLLFALGLAVVPSAASPANLLTNSTFDTDLSGWLVVNDSLSQVTFDATLDANSSPTSGSARYAKAAGMSCVPNLYQCVDGITAGKAYDLGGSINIPIGQPANSDAFIALAWFTGAACTASRIVAPAAGVIPTFGVWTSVSANNEVAPAGAVSAAVNVTGCNPLGLPLDANFDQLFLQPSSTVPPFTDIRVLIEGPVRVAPGGPVEYGVRVKNLGPNLATGIRPGVYLPSGLGGVVVAGGGTYDPATGFLSWPLFDNIAVGGEQLFSFTLPNPVDGKGYAVAAMINGDTDYSNNTVAFQLAPATEPVPALAPWAAALLSLLLLAAAAPRVARRPSRRSILRS